MPNKTRVESDSLGDVRVPSGAFWGSFTQRVIRNFPISKNKVPLQFIRNYITLKKLYAEVNLAVAKLDPKVGKTIIRSCNALLGMSNPRLRNFFPITVIQSGGGTSTNMMMNEVIANFAEVSLRGKKGRYSTIHPNNHVNMSQSSNDTFPSVTKITAYQQAKELLKELDRLKDALRTKSKEFATIPKLGRTHLQDAVPMTLGDELSAFERSVEKDMVALKKTFSLLSEIPFGATALGSKQNISVDIRKELVSIGKKAFKIPLRQQKNYFEGTSSSRDFLAVSNALSVIATNMSKMSADLRLLASGPDGGLGEISLPATQPGSSIMPGKVNPSVLEALEMVCFRVMGNDSTIQHATSRAQLQLQVFMPLIAFVLYESFDLLTQSISVLTMRCIRGIKAQPDNIRENLEKSTAYATQYSEELGYDTVAKIVARAKKEGLNVRELLEEERSKK